MFDCSSEVKKKKRQENIVYKTKALFARLPAALPSMLLGCEKMLTTWICVMRTEAPQKATDIFSIFKFWEILAN